MHWDDFKLWSAIGIGLLMAFLLSAASTIKARLTSVVGGLFFAIFFTGPLISWAGLEFSVWQYAIAGLLAMTGDRIARRVLNVVDTGSIPNIGGKK